LCGSQILYKKAARLAEMILEHYVHTRIHDFTYLAVENRRTQWQIVSLQFLHHVRWLGNMKPWWIFQSIYNTFCILCGKLYYFRCCSTFLCEKAKTIFSSRKGRGERVCECKNESVQPQFPHSTVPDSRKDSRKYGVSVSKPNITSGLRLMKTQLSFSESRRKKSHLDI
jgi:hypothetical protein